MSFDADIDRLYQLPPPEFIAERNALAKRAGARGADIRALPKPTLPVWAVNQLHWRHPEIYRSLLDTAENLRATHKAVLAGRRGDLRAASRAHEEALDAALKAALAIAAEGGNPASDAVRQTIGTTLRALPAADPPGRLRQALMPGGFEALTGLPAGGRVVPPSTAARSQKAAAPTRTPSTAAPRTKPDKAALARARKVAADAAKALSSAEQASRREEFEAARAARDADAAQRRVAGALKAVETAQAELAQAEEDAAAAVKKRDAARTRAASADKALATARAHADAARRELLNVER
jgi:hypothetical protein